MTFPESSPFLPGRGEPSLRWGILAPGSIARAFASVTAARTEQRIVAVGSRSLERAEAFASSLGIERAYGSYEQLVADPDVDAVYVAAPHSEHLALALLAIGSGKHVLVEKPLTTNAADARILLDAARAAGVFAMEAMWTRYLPQSGVIRALVDDGTLGEVQQVFADHGQALLHVPRLVRPELGGGALLDLGIYAFAFASQWLGAPTGVVTTGALTGAGVDAWSSTVLTYPGGAAATLSTSMVTTTPTTASVNGSLARVELAGDFYVPTRLRLVARGGEPEEWNDTSGVVGHEGLSWQATAMAGYIGEGRLESPLHPHEETIAILAAIDEARQQLEA